MYFSFDVNLYVKTLYELHSTAVNNRTTKKTDLGEAKDSALVYFIMLSVPFLGSNGGNYRMTSMSAIELWVCICTKDFTNSKEHCCVLCKE